MSEIRFYHLQNQRVEQALPLLLMKALSTDKRIVVKGVNEKRMKQLNETLWTYDANSFLPHGVKSDGFSSDQPIYLTTDDENPNYAEILITIDGANLCHDNQFTMQCHMFDGDHPDHLQRARAQWRSLQEAEHDLTYWQQTANGWEEKS